MMNVKCFLFKFFKSVHLNGLIHYFCHFRELQDWQPYRSSEEESDDPDRTVSLDDVKPFLQVFQDPANKFKLAVSFLQFMGCDFSNTVSSNF